MWDPDPVLYIKYGVCFLVDLKECQCLFGISLCHPALLSFQLAPVNKIPISRNSHIHMTWCLACSPNCRHRHCSDCMTVPIRRNQVAQIFLSKREWLKLQVCPIHIHPKSHSFTIMVYHWQLFLGHVMSHYLPHHSLSQQLFSLVAGSWNRATIRPKTKSMYAMIMVYAFIAWEKGFLSNPECRHPLSSVKNKNVWTYG